MKRLTENNESRSEKKRGTARGIGIPRFVLPLLTVLSLFAAVLLFALFLPGKNASPPPSPEAGTVGELSTDAPEKETLSIPNGGALFRISDAETLYLLADSGAFGEFFAANGEDPIVIIERGSTVTLDRTLYIDSGITLDVEGELVFADESVKIVIDAEGEHTISIFADAPLSRYDIDAPDSSLCLEGGDIPFIREVAETQNVASYNGTPTAGAADGDTLGGEGNARAVSAELYHNAKKTDAWDGASSVVSGNLITLFVPHDVSDADIKSLHVSVKTDEGGKCDLPDKLDLSSPALVTVTDGAGRGRVYRLSVERARLGIPIMSIYTTDGSGIDSDLEYETAVMYVDGEEYTLSVKGRGSSSWWMFPKHSYRLKLDKKARLCGLNSDRDFCLIGNYIDPSLLRNIVASDMASVMTGMPYTPKYQSVDVFINGTYSGVYALSEKIEEDDDKVSLGERVTDEKGNIKDLGFLIEIGWDRNSANVRGVDYFHTRYCWYQYIKEPEITKKGSAEYKYISSYVRAAENAIVRGSGYEEYIDVDSWVDWFIVNELTNNTEGAFYRSLYMYKPVGGKLTAGPIWDFDTAFGNNTGDIDGYDGWASVDFTYEYLYDNWMKFLTKNKAFMDRVRERWQEMKGALMETAKNSVESHASEIEASTVYNFKVWKRGLTSHIGLGRATRLGFRTWRRHVDYIMEFLEMRYEWMDAKLS